MQTRTNSIQQGWNVYGSDDEKVGTVDQVASNYLIIQKGWFFVSDVYVPFQAIDSVDAENGSVYLNVAKGDIDSQGWNEPPMESENTQEWEGWAARGDRNATRTDRDNATIALHEEELQAQKTNQEVGSVNIRKNVVEEQQSIDVPVMHEEVEIRRTAVDRPGDTGTAFQSEEIEVPVRAERVEVSKTPHVVEEVEISKTGREETQTVSDTVRREQVDVGTTGDTQVRQSGQSGRSNELGREYKDDEV